MNQVLTEKAAERLQKFLEIHDKRSDIEVLTPDASTREYFRVGWNVSTAIACVYPEMFSPKEQSYLDVSNLFLTGGLPVAKIFDFDARLGVIVLEDFGDTILRDVLAVTDTTKKENLLGEAITLIAEIQKATPKAFELDSIASRLKFDEEKLNWELDFFKTHYFETFRNVKFSQNGAGKLNKEFAGLSKELETRAKVLCHRDFHAANLMIDREKRLRIIDHQDARIGAASYDLVSLLLDRVLEPPHNDWLGEKKRFFLSERERLGLEKIAFEDFDYEFDLMSVQRCLKAIGTFSFQSINRGKTHFIQYIEPMFRIVLQACDRLQRFSFLQNIIEEIALK